MSGLKFTRRAQEDVQQIHDFIADDNPAAALAVIAQIETRCNGLSGKIGKNRDQIEKGLRSIAEGRYLIFFQEAEGSILIVRVLHGAREIEKLFDPQ